MSETSEAQPWKQPLEDLRTTVDRFSERVAPVYRVLGWKWSDSGAVPDATAIAKTCRELIQDVEDALNSEPAVSYFVATGGLRVEFKDAHPLTGEAHATLSRNVATHSWDASREIPS